MLVFLNLHLWNTRFVSLLTPNFREGLTNTHFLHVPVSKYRLAEFLLVHHMTSMHIQSQYLKFVTDTPKDAYHHHICNLHIIQVYFTKCTHILKMITIPNFILLAEIVNYFSDMGFLQQLLLNTSVFQDGLLWQLVNSLMQSYQMECHILIIQSHYFIDLWSVTSRKVKFWTSAIKSYGFLNVAPTSETCTVIKVLLVNTKH